MGGAEVLLVMTTLPDAQAARVLARALVEARLAACVSIQSGCVSVYRWEGALEQAHEVPMLIKTTPDRYPALERASFERGRHWTPVEFVTSSFL